MVFAFYGSIVCMTYLTQLIISCVLHSLQLGANILQLTWNSSKNLSRSSRQLRLAERWPPGWFADPCLSQLLSADKIMCLFNAARVIVKGWLVSAMSLSPVHFYDFSAFCLQLPTVVVQITNPPAPVTRLITRKKRSYRLRLGRRKMLKERGKTERQSVLLRHK